MQRRVVLAAVLAGIIAYPTTALAVTIHKHHTEHELVRQGRPGAPPIYKAVRVSEVVKVPPKDSDDDGFANGVDNCPSDHYLGNGGCTPQPVVTQEPATGTLSSSPVAPAPAPSVATSSSGDWGSVPGVPSSFASCVAYRESTNGTNPAAGGNVYGILDPVPGTDPVADPKGAMAALYAQSGAGAWSPYDGC